MPITPETTLRDVLRHRPRSIEVLEAESGFEFWNNLDLTVTGFCGMLGSDRERMIARVASLPHDTHHRNWSALPLYHLVDRLVCDHIEFRETDLPEIERVLFTSDSKVFPVDYPLDAIKLEFHSFKIDLLLHMEEEEGFLFPMALRAEGSVNHPEIQSESHNGSISAYSGTMLHTPDLQLKEMISDLRRNAGWAEAPGKAYPLVKEVESRMESLEARLIRHADLETGILLPRTMRMEEELLRRRRETDLLD